MSAVVLLVEQTAADAGRFTGLIKEEVGDDVQIVWKRTISDAKRHLQANEVDQIWIDRADFASTTDVDAEVKYFQQFVPSDQVIVLGTVTTAIRSGANNQEAQFVSKEGLFNNSIQDNQILQVVLEMLRKRSSGATTKVELGKQEVRLLHMEGKVDRMESLFEDMRVGIGQLLSKQQEFVMEMQVMKPLLNKIPDIEKKLSQRESGDTLRIERWKVVATVVGSILTAVSVISVAIAQFILPRLIDQQKQEVKQEIQKDITQGATSSSGSTPGSPSPKKPGHP